MKALSAAIGIGVGLYGIVAISPVAAGIGAVIVLGATQR